MVTTISINATTGRKLYGRAESANTFRFPDRPSHMLPIRNLHVSSMPATMPRVAIADFENGDSPGKKLNKSSLASGSQTARNARTCNHEMAALSAATFILIMTRSIVLSGRTATIAGIDKSVDQKSGLENA